MKQTELGLGHSYSRGKVKFNVNRADNMIIQSIALVDQLDKDINTFAMRIKYVCLSLSLSLSLLAGWVPSILWLNNCKGCIYFLN